MVTATSIELPTTFPDKGHEEPEALGSCKDRDLEASSHRIPVARGPPTQEGLGVKAVGAAGAVEPGRHHGARWHTGSSGLLTGS